MSIYLGIQRVLTEKEHADNRKKFMGDTEADNADLDMHPVQGKRPPGHQHPGVLRVNVPEAKHSGPIPKDMGTHHVWDQKKGK